MSDQEQEKQGDGDETGGPSAPSGDDAPAEGGGDDGTDDGGDEAS